MTDKRLRPASRALAALALSLASLLGVGVPAVSAQPRLQPEATTEPPSVSVTVIPEDNGIVAPDASVPATITVRNDTSETLPAGTVTLGYSAIPFTDRAALSQWLGGEGDVQAPRTVGDAETPELRPGASTTINSVELSDEDLGLSELLPRFGAYPIQAIFRAGDTQASDNGSFIWQPGNTPSDVRVAVAVPIVAPSSGVGTIPAEDLEKYTSPSGPLTRQLDAIIDTPAAIGIDPRIIVSIRVLGTTAPASATRWLDRLAGATNEIFPLQYGDANAALQVDAAESLGRPLTSLLAPTSFEYALVEQNFAGIPISPSPDAESQGTTAATKDTEKDSPSPDPTPDPDEDAPKVPSLEQLLDWDYTATNIVWPADGTVSAGDLDIFRDGDDSASTIMSSRNIGARVEYTPGAAGQAGGSPVLISDDGLSDALRAAGAARTTDARSEAVSGMYSELAAIGAEQDAPNRTLLVTLDRGWVENSAAIGDVLGELDDAPGVRMSTLSAARGADRVPVDIIDGSVDKDQISAAATLLDGERDLTSFASILGDGRGFFLGKERAQILALLAVGWPAEPAEWDAAIAEHHDQTETSLDAVAVVTASQFNMISGQASLPFSVKNDLLLPVTIVVQTQASNPRLDVDPVVTATVNANSRETVQVPVQARLGNGEVDLHVQLLAEDGTAIGTPVDVTVNVRADWEGIGAVGLVVLVLLLFVGGLLRTISRRRSTARAALARESGESDTSDSDDDTTPNESPADATQDQDGETPTGVLPSTQERGTDDTTSSGPETGHGTSGPRNGDTNG